MKSRNLATRASSGRSAHALLATPSPRRRALAWSAVVLAAISAASPALAQGGWVPGAALDPVLGVPTYFGRYVAAQGEGQLTIRCAVGAGVTIDAGVPLGGRLPEGMEIGGRGSVSIKIIPVEGAPVELPGEGEVRLRSDGAVLITVEGEQAMALAAAFNKPAQTTEITIGGKTASVPMATAATAIGSVSRFCPEWPD